MPQRTAPVDMSQGSDVDGSCARALMPDACTGDSAVGECALLLPVGVTGGKSLASADEDRFPASGRRLPLSCPVQ